MKTIVITNFGAVKKVNVQMDRNMQVFIGPQASGKSTIGKVIYFVRKIRDYTFEFLLDAEQFSTNHPNEYFTNYLKYLTRQFMGCFGTTKHMDAFSIQYNINDSTYIHIALVDKYVRFSMSSDLKKSVEQLITEARALFLRKQNERTFSFFNKFSELDTFRTELETQLFAIFDDDSEIIYIPAGRSLLASMSEQLYDIPLSQMDLTMQEFIRLTRTAKNSFNAKIPDVIERYTRTVKGQINNLAVKQAYNLIKKILHADYVNDTDGEKMYFDDEHWVELMYSSSGQQESLWILQLLFATILEQRKSFCVIEEPEAHLFPSGQRDIVNLISLMVNATQSQVIITTHSPYVLTSLNVLLYSDRIESRLKNRTADEVIPRNYRLKASGFTAYKILIKDNERHILQSIFDNDTGLIDASYIDEVSETTNTDLEKLIALDSL